MKRREFIAGIGSAAAWQLVARGQSGVPVVGSLHGVSALGWASRMAAFRGGLGEIGFVEGRNIAIEYRWSDGQSDRLPALVDDLVRRKVAVLVVGGSDVAVRTAMWATKTIPIVFYTASNPVEAGFVPSIARPGGNVTGVTALSTEISEKRIELLHELVPGVAKVALLVNPSNPRLAEDVIQRTEAAARGLGIKITVLKASTGDEIGSVIAAAAQQQVGAISVANDAYLDRGVLGPWNASPLLVLLYRDHREGNVMRERESRAVSAFAWRSLCHMPLCVVELGLLREQGVDVDSIGPSAAT